MNTEAQQLTVIEQRPDELPIARDLHLFARDPAELAEAQGHLIRWCNAKLQEISADLQDLRENVAIAKKNKWRPAAWQVRLKKAGQQYQFYLKVKKALEAGYYIVPPFPVEVFAIRIGPKARPTTTTLTESSYTHRARSIEHAPSDLPPGEGRYVPPRPHAYLDTERRRNDKGEVVEQKVSRMGAWRDMQFPIALVKPQILDETGKAMALKVFDQMGVLPSRGRNPDPVVLGQIRNPKGGPALTFFVGWWLSTRDL